MIIDKEVSMEWTRLNKKIYESKGYIFTFYGDIFFVSILDLTKASAKSILFKCDSCDKNKYITFCNYKKSKSFKEFYFGYYICNKCTASHYRTSNTDTFKKRVFTLVGNEYKVLGEYIGSMSKIELYHESCGNTYFSTPSMFINSKSRCPKCFGTQLKNTEVYKQEVLLLVGNEYTVLGEYIKSSINLDMRHNICGHLYKVRPNSFLRGDRCPKCSGHMKFNLSDFSNEVYKIEQNNYSVIGLELINKKIKIKHNICGYEYEVPPFRFIAGLRCHQCSGLMNKTHEQFIREIKALVNEEYVVLGIYERSSANILMKHNLCGIEWKANPNSFLRGTRCPECASSKGERKIKDILIENKIKFETQYKFFDCKNVNSLPFDFAILDTNGNIEKLIEYDGKQHYEPVEFFGGLDGFEKNKKNDEIKNEYCKRNDIDLVRIPYYEYKKLDTIIKDLISHKIEEAI